MNQSRDEVERFCDWFMGNVPAVVKDKLTTEDAAQLELES